MFLTLFRKVLGPAESRATKSVFGKAMAKIAHLPSLPDTSTRAMALANDPGASLADFSNLIKRDGAIATATLKLANSPLYRVGKPVEELHQAVLRLGLRTCSDLVTSIGMRGLFRNAKRETLERCELLWRHSFFTASMSTQLNVALKLADRGRIRGLLHDLGRFMIALVVPNGPMPAIRSISMKTNIGWLRKRKFWAPITAHSASATANSTACLHPLLFATSCIMSRAKPPSRGEKVTSWSL
ncbi:MAG: HDOD domain-containing protein [Gemmataceae bacterium]